MRRIELNSASCSPQDIVDAMNFHCNRIIEEYSSEVRKRWKENVDNAINNQVSGKYTRTLICSYRDLCDCNAKMKLDYSMSTHSISLLWYSFGFSHGMPSTLNNRFAKFEEHEKFVHTRIKQKSEYDVSCSSISLTIELREHIERTLIECPTMTPNSLVKEMQDSFPNYSSRYWVLATKSIRSYRSTITKILKQCGPSSAEYHNDSFISIRDWVANNTFDVVSRKSDFNLFTLFVAAHEINQDMSAPPMNERERSEWTPVHKIRIVLCSIAMSLNFPIMQLKPSLHRYLCIAADSTFKLAVHKLIKVSVFILFQII